MQLSVAMMILQPALFAQQDLAGRYTGRILIDETSVPAGVKGSNRDVYLRDHKQLRKVRISLELGANKAFNLQFSGGNMKKPMASSGKWHLQKSELVLTAFNANGKKLATPIVLKLRVKDKGKHLVHEKPYGGNSQYLFTKVK